MGSHSSIEKSVLNKQIYGYNNNKTRGSSCDMVIKDNLVVAISTNGLVLIDISDPSRPYELSETETKSNGGYSEQNGVDIKDNIAFCFGDKGLVSVDISNNKNPKVLQKINTKCTLSCAAIKIIDDYAIIFGGGALACVDISDPRHMIILDKIETGASSNSVHSQYYHEQKYVSIFIKDNNTAFVYGARGLASIDISNKKDIKVIQKIETHTTQNNASVAQRDNLVYVYGSKGFGTVDVNKLDDMRPLDQIDTECNKWQQGNDHLLQGDYAIIAGKHGIGVVDITDPIRLKMFKKIDELDVGTTMCRRSIKLHPMNNELLCCQDHRGFYIINIKQVCGISDFDKYSIFDSSKSLVPSYEEYENKFKDK